MHIDPNKLGPDGSTIVGWQKPPMVPTPAPAAPAADKVKVVRKDGSTVKEIDRTDYNARSRDYQVIETDGAGRPMKVREARFIGK